MPGSSIAINGVDVISGTTASSSRRRQHFRGAATTRLHLHATLSARGLILHSTRTGRWKLPRWSKNNMALPSAPFGGLCPQLRSLCRLARGNFTSDGGHVCHTGTSGAQLDAAFAQTPPSPEGDHLLRTPDAEAHVLPPHPAPVPPRRNALRCIRDGTVSVYEEPFGRGNSQQNFFSRIFPENLRQRKFLPLLRYL